MQNVHHLDLSGIKFTCKLPSIAKSEFVCHATQLLSIVS